MLVTKKANLIKILNLIYVLVLILHLKNLNYQIDGKDYSSSLVKTKGNKKVIIFIIHDWNGLNKYEKSVQSNLQQMSERLKYNLIEEKQNFNYKKYKDDNLEYDKRYYRLHFVSVTIPFLIPRVFIEMGILITLIQIL